MSLASIEKRIKAANRLIQPDLVIKNANVVNVFSHEVRFGNLAIADGMFLGMGDYDCDNVIDADGRYIAPGLIDSHVHIESSFGTPYQFARAVLPHGTTTVIADCHEIANVCGVSGIQYMLDSTQEIPLTVYMMLPSCVPASSFETSGAILEAEQLSQFMNHERVLGLGELMNYPGVVSADKNIVKKLKLAFDADKIVDGHGPGQTKEVLNAYIIAGVKTDHECTNFDEMMERIQNGMYVAIRQGSAAKNLVDLMCGVNGYTERRCTFCTDDRHPEDIIKKGHIDNNIRVAIKNGMDPITAIRLASLNSAECYGIKKLGAIAPGYIADFIMFDSLQDFNVLETFKNGQKVEKDWHKHMPYRAESFKQVKGVVNIGDITKTDLKIAIDGETAKVIKLNANSLMTDNVNEKVMVKDGNFVMDQAKDTMPIYVLERHKNTGNIGKGLIAGFGLKGGAIASTVAHDSHNLVVVGDSDRDILLAINEIKRIGGGLALVKDGAVLGSLALDIAGIMSSERLEVIAAKQDELTKMAYSALGISEDFSPFMTLAFMALTVIPDLKITDKGLFDVKKFELTTI
jgi:adenine deaminase